MADEPSWDEIFARSTPADGSDDAPARRSTWTSLQPSAETPLDERSLQPRSRRELRERERAQAARSAGATPIGSASERPAGQQPEQARPTVEQSAPLSSAQPGAAGPAAPEPRRSSTTIESPVTVPMPFAELVDDADDGAGVAGGATTSGGAGGRGSRGRKPPKEPRRGRTRAQKRGAWILVVVLVVVLGGGTAGVVTVWNRVSPGVEAIFGKKASDDYTGSGNGKKVNFTIVQGDIGSTIADKLAKADITKSAAVPYQLLLANPNINFLPGTYSMYEHMSASAAIARLQETTSRITTQLVVPEGTTLKGIISLMTSVTKLKAADIQAAANDYKSYGLPSNATSLEGYLFPATYSLEPGKTAHAYFQTMVDTMKQHLQTAGVTPANYEHTIIFASLIQREAGLAADFPKVARVFQNRIDDGMLLQSDATVAYGAGTTGRVTTTDAERADASNKYNTYVHKGLPIGPISNPGDTALQAALHPATGSWVYFVTVNLETGQTVFSTTYAEHQVAVAQFQTWLRAHPSYNK